MAEKMESGGSSPASGKEAGGVPKSTSDRRIIRGTKAPDIPMYERKNWLIHQHYIKKDFGTCKVLIQEILDETDEMCEYALCVLGLIYRQEGDIEKSLEQFRKAVALNPNNPYNVKQVARSLFLQGKHKAAMETFAEASTMNPKDWELLHNQGVCCIFLKDLDKAIELFQSAISLSPQTLSFKQLGKAFLTKGAVEDAIEIFIRAVKLNPEDPDLLTLLGLLYLHKGSHQKCLDCFGRALTFDTTNPKAILAVGSMFQNDGQLDVALSKYRAAASKVPESPTLWNNIGMCFFGMKKYVAAISCLKRAIYLAPLEWKVLYNLGLVHLHMEKYASAFHFLRAAVGYKPPQLGKIQLLLAIALSHLDDLENAMQMYWEAVKEDKDNPYIHINFAIFLHNLGKFKQSQHSYEVFKTKKYPTDADSKMLAEISKKLGPVLATGESPRKAKNKAPPTKRDPTATTEKKFEESQEAFRSRQPSVFQKVHDL